MPDSAPPAPPRPHRPLPVEWRLAEALAGHAQSVAKGWLLLLLERAPLAAVGSIPAAELAAEGPAICAAAARALGSDVELARIGSDGDLAPLVRRIGALTASPDAVALVGAVDALRACLFAGALDASGPGRDVAEVAALAERAAEVGAVLAATAIGAADAATAASAAPGSVAELPARPAPAPDSHPAPRGAVGGSLASMDDGELWVATLERHVDRVQREGGGLALLRVELADSDRLVAGATPEEQGVPYGRLAQAIRRAIRRQDLVASDHQGRAWVIAPGVGRAGATALAERIGAGVEGGEPWRGAPLTATIGFAVYGEDGRDAAALIDRAEEAMLAASAAGLRIGEAVPDGGDADRPGPRLVR